MMGRASHGSLNGVVWIVFVITTAYIRTTIHSPKKGLYNTYNNNVVPFWISYHELKIDILSYEIILEKYFLEHSFWSNEL